MPLPDRALSVAFHHPSDLGAGAGTRALGLIAALRHHGWLVEAAREDGVAEQERLADNGLHETEAIRHEADRLVKRWTSLRPDLVHIEVPGSEALAWKIAAKRLGLPLTTTHHRLHNWLPVGTTPAQRAGIIAFNHDFMAACRLVLIELPEERAELAAQGILETAHVTNGVHCSKFTPSLRSEALRSTWKATAETPVLLYVGRVLPAKGLALLADTFLAAHQQNPDAVMVVVGDGDGLEELQRRCPFAVYTGMLRGADLSRAYASGDIFVFPSQIDNFGTVTTEAMASGLACVAFNRAAAGACIIDGINGRLVTSGEDFITATCDLLAHPERVRQYGQAAVQKAQTITWDATGAAADAAFRHVIATHAARQTTTVEPLALVIRAPLPFPQPQPLPAAPPPGIAELHSARMQPQSQPQPLPAGVRALIDRGHHLSWIDPAQEPCERPGQVIDVAEVNSAWSPKLARCEARWTAQQFGLIPSENPLYFSIILSTDRAVDARLKRLANSLRRLGHPAELTPAADAERTWQATPPDAVYLCGQALALAPRARHLGLRVCTTTLPEGVDTDLYHPRQRQADIRHAWNATDTIPVVLLLVTTPDEATCATLRALTLLTNCTLVAACLTAAAAQTLRTAGFTTTMVEGIPGAHLPKVLASADLVVLPGPQPTRSAILSTLACGATLVLTTAVEGLPDEVYCSATHVTADLQVLASDTTRQNTYSTAGRTYAEAHTWITSAQTIVEGML